MSNVETSKPNSYQQYLNLAVGNSAVATRCISCKEPFNERNVRSPEGWAETQISSTCETCFDEIFEGLDKEIENHEEDPF